MNSIIVRAIAQSPLPTVNATMPTRYVRRRPQRSDQLRDRPAEQRTSGLAALQRRQPVRGLLAQRFGGERRQERRGVVGRRPGGKPAFEHRPVNRDESSLAVEKRVQRGDVAVTDQRRTRRRDAS